MLLLLASYVFLPVRLYAAEPIRIGCFPNITHSHALLGKALGTFENKPEKN